jgi:hypothetical protein
MMTLLASCATSHNRQKKAQGDVVELRTVEDIIAKEKSSQVKKKLAHNTKSASSTKSKSLELNYQQKHFKFWKKYFSKREEARFIRHLNNGLMFKSIVDRVLLNLATTHILSQKLPLLGHGSSLKGRQRDMAFVLMDLLMRGVAFIKLPLQLLVTLETFIIFLVVGSSLYVLIMQESTVL